MKKTRKSRPVYQTKNSLRKFLEKWGILIAILVTMAVTLPLLSQKSRVLSGKTGCTTVQDGTLTYSAGHYLAGQEMATGYDAFGYNYEAHLFRGRYANVYLGREGLSPYFGDTASYLAVNPSAAGKWYWPYRDVKLEMKWNDAWLSNKDCNGDKLLDRPPSYIGSGAWETNHQSGEESDDNGKKICKWNYFVKIVAVPEGATKPGGVWQTADGKEIGPDIWGTFAIIEEVSNDPCAGQHGKQYVSPNGAGFGKY